MIPFFIGLVSCIGTFFRSRYNLGLEIIALRQQLGVLKRKQPRRADRLQCRLLPGGRTGTLLREGLLPPGASPPGVESSRIDARAVILRGGRRLRGFGKVL
jgi:hypothetical protein